MKKIQNLFHIVFLPLFSIIVALMIGTTFVTLPLAGVVFLLLAFGIYMFYYKNKIPFHIRNEKREKCNNMKMTWLGIQIFSTVLMLFLSFRLQVHLSWDWGVVMRTAIHYVEYGVIGDPEYYAMYTNNQFWLVCLIAFFKVVKFIFPSAQTEQFQTASILLTCAIMQLTIFILYRTACLIYDRRKAVLLGGIAACCLPIYLYAQFAYTDAPGMLLCALLLYFHYKVKKSTGKNSIIFLCLLGITGALALKIKVMVFIVFIGIILEMAVKASGFIKMFVHICIMLTTLLLTLFLLQKVTDRYLPISEAMSEEVEFPPTHWIMMGLNSSGGYKEEDVTFTGSFPTYAEKKAANLSEIGKRVEAYGVKGMLKHIFYTKLKRTWCVSSLNGDDYVGRDTMYDTVFQKVFTKKGSLHESCLIYTSVYHLFVLVGIWMSGFWALLKKDHDSLLLAGRISVFGIVLFLSLWECNSRYLVCFLPVLLLTAFDGFRRFCKLDLNVT